MISLAVPRGIMNSSASSLLARSSSCSNNPQANLLVKRSFPRGIVRLVAVKLDSRYCTGWSLSVTSTTTSLAPALRPLITVQLNVAWSPERNRKICNFWLLSDLHLGTNWSDSDILMARTRATACLSILSTYQHSSWRPLVLWLTREWLQWRQLTTGSVYLC